MTDDRVLDTIKRLSANLTPGDLDHTLERITAAAVEVLPGVHYASITVKHADGSLGTAAPTDQMLLGLDAPSTSCVKDLATTRRSTSSTSAHRTSPPTSAFAGTPRWR
jgi:hypothetical protein